MKANHSFHRAKYLSLGVIIVLIGGCNRGPTNTPTGPTKREVVERFRQPYAAMSERLKQIAQQLPARGSVKNNVSESKKVTRVNLEPAPSYKWSAAKGQVNDNTGVMAAERLLDPEATPEFDLMLPGFPQDCFYWLGPKFAAAADLTMEDHGSLQNGFEAGLARRYLLVYRTARFDRPMVIDSTSYKPGAIALEVFLVDLQSNKIVTSFLASAQTAQEARYPANANIGVHVVDTLRQNVRAAIADGIAMTTGGAFEYR